MEFHIGTEHYYISMSPWSAFMTLLLVVVILLSIGGMILARHTWICHNCGKRFKKKWWQLMISVHMNGKRLMTCPHCKERDMCSTAEKEGP